MSLALNRGEENVHFEVWGRRVEMPGFDGGNLEDEFLRSRDSSLSIA